MAPSLSVRVGDRSWTFDPRSTVTVGRAVDCDVVLDDPKVSRRHLRIAYDNGWTVSDLGSTHGTWVRGRRVDTWPVSGAVTVGLAGQALELSTSGTAVVTVGRALDNDLVLNDVRVSRHHARLERTGTGWCVTDLGGRNPTLVNARPAVGTTPVADGDRLTFGGTDVVLDGDDLVPAGTSRAVLAARDVGYQAGGRVLLAGIDLDAGPGELIAVVGPSGAGKSTLLKVLTGRLRPDTGFVSYDDYDVHDQFDAVSRRLGLVPQEDLVHHRLTAREALTYAATIRLPADVTADERAAVVAKTLVDMELTDKDDIRIGKLSSGQRKRVSVALELLTSPSLLLLDEPTSGLDPALDRHLMSGLRAIADAGRTVVVVTHNVANLGQCDKVLLLAPGGIPVFTGPPQGLATRFGTDDWAEIFSRVAALPSTPVEPLPTRERPRPTAPAEHSAPRRGAAVGRQIRTLAARHVRLIIADPGYACFLFLLPVVLGVLALTVPGDSGLRNGTPADAAEAGQILVLLFVGAAFMGGAAGAREVIGERGIVLRELTSGVSPVAYATAKAGVFTVVCAVQAALLVGVLAVLTPRPTNPVLLPNASVEIGVAVWMTTIASCLLSLLGSALVRSSEQAMPVLVVTVMAQLVLCGGMIPVTDRVVLEELSWLAPARWGYSAGASTVDLTRTAPPMDQLWQHNGTWWSLSIGVLVVSMALSTTLLVRRMRRLSRR